MNVKTVLVDIAGLKRLQDERNSLREENKRLRETLHDLREWVPQDATMEFDDGDISVQEYISNALAGEVKP